MKKLKQGAICFFVLAALLCVAGCGEYVPRTVYEITTKDGKTINLACPVIEAGRSEFTYLIDGDCVVYKG